MALNLNETATLTLQMNNGDVSKSIDQLDAKAKELNKTIKEIEKNGGKGSENWQKYKNELNQVKTATSQLKKEVDVSTLSYGQLQNLIKALNKDLKGLKPGTDEFNAAVKRLSQAEAQLKKVDGEVKKIKQGGEDLGKPGLWQKITGGVGTMATAFQAFMALQVIGYIVDIGKAIFETTAKFEKYEKVLTTAFGGGEGGTKLAKQSMEAIKQLAKDSVFSVDELTDGYVKMVNRGLRPSQKEMVALTDLAASQGKSFDQLVEGLLDASTEEFERLKEFGTRASKAGEQVTYKFKDAELAIKNTGSGFEVLDKATGKVINTFKNQEDATIGVLTALGEMDGVQHQNKEMMETLNGKASNLGDSFDALKVELGQGLKPVFSAILELLSKSIPVLSFVGKAVGSVLLTAKNMAVGVWDTLSNVTMAIVKLGEAGIEYVKGNTSAGKKALDEAKDYGKKSVTSIVANVKTGVEEIGKVWTNPEGAIKAEFAGKEQGQKYQNKLTEEQKKAQEKREKEAEKARKKEEAEHKQHLDKISKANEEAILKTAELEAETYLKTIKDELAREQVKLMQKRDMQAEAIMRSVADEKSKAAQIAALNDKLNQELSNLNDEYRKKQVEAERKAAQERLEANNFIREQERKAEMAILDFKELAARNNTKELLSLAKTRSEKELTFKKDQLADEEKAEIAKAQAAAARRLKELGEVKDKAEQEKIIAEQLAQTEKAIGDRFRQETKAAEEAHSAELKRIKEEELEAKRQKREAFSGAFKALLAGDLSAFVDNASKMVKGEEEAWQKRLQENISKYEMVAEVAQAATSFINDLTQKRLDKAIDASKKETQERLDAANKMMEAEIAAAEETAAKELQNENLTAQQKAAIEKKLADQKEKIKKNHEQSSDKIRQEGATKEKELARQKWKAQQRADIASALISGALATIKALASGMFPLNLVFAAVTAAMTAMQVIKIKQQPEPQFAHGGFVPQGPRHKAEYGKGGIGLFDNETGRNVGEMEGGEAIISRDQTEANWPIIQQMFRNARTPGRQRASVLQDRPAMAFRDGGIFESSYWNRGTYLFGSKKAKKQAAAAEAEAKAAASADVSVDASSYSGDVSGSIPVEGSSDANAQYQAAAAQGKEQLELLKQIRDAVEASDQNMQASVAALRGPIGAVEGAVRDVKSAVDGVSGAVNASNQSTRMEALIAAVSSFGGKE